MKTACRRAFALAMACFVHVSPALAAPGRFKVATFNIQSGSGEPGLPGRTATFAKNGNCTDRSQPLNAWGVGFVQAALTRDLAADPSIIALALSESWETVCGSPLNVQNVLGWVARTQSRNGTALVARYGFAGPERWMQLDTSLNVNPADTVWIVRVPVCLDARCTASVPVFATHWFGNAAEYEIQAEQTIHFMQSFPDTSYILAGDLNVWEDPALSVCRQSPSPYGLGQLRTAGYIDAWPFVHGDAEGDTGMTNRVGCGEPEGYVWKRIDYLWSAGAVPVSATRFATAVPGEESPSDHYGLVAGYSIDVPEVVLYARDASAISGTWHRVSDSTAAGGEAIAQSDAGRPKVTTALADPIDYFELTFGAIAGQPYRLWLRMRAESDYYGNDSVHVQFDDAVGDVGERVYQIGTRASTVVVLQECTGCVISGWGWQDNGYGTNVLGPLLYFEKSGRHTIRIQRREDGVSIDQIVLSPNQYLAVAPGAVRDDQTILGDIPAPSGSSEIVLHARTAATITGTWNRVSDATAAGGEAVAQPDLRVPKISPALPYPGSYFELAFDANRGQPYHLWLRMKADRNYYANDSVHVQFSGTVNALGEPVYAIGTSSSAVVVLEDCSGCVISGWGWQDNAYGPNQTAPPIYFATTGRHTIRIQTREDGVSIDQIVLSSVQYLAAAPGAVRDDTTILAPR